MTGSEHKPPAVRFPPVISGAGSEGEATVGDVVVELPVSNKFGFTWPNDPPPPFHGAERLGQFNSSGSESNSSEEEMSLAATEGPSHIDQDDEPTPTTNSKSLDPPLVLGAPPRFSRAFSMPLPSQLGHLQNPRRTTSFPPAILDPSPGFSPFHFISLELADSVQMIIQTLLHVSPPQVLDPTKEQFSACSLSIPTPSMSAMLTSMKNLNYISAHMATLCMEPPDVHQPSEAPPNCTTDVFSDFDVGEMLQNVGDALSGVAAQAGVDLVLFHGDLGVKLVAVKGDESGISFALSHVVRQVICTARRGDCIEICLLVTLATSNSEGSASSTDTSESVDASTSPLELDKSLLCTFVIAHKFAPSEFTVDGPHEKLPSSPVSRLEPNFSTLLLRRLLRQVGASLVPNVPPKTFPIGRVCELAVTLGPGSPSTFRATMSSSANEPTMDELLQFTEILRGKKVTLYASSKGAFAQHLTSYLTTWGLDVSHVSSDLGQEDCAVSSDVPSSPGSDPRTSPVQSAFPTGVDSFATLGQTPSSTQDENQGGSRPMSFIIIDDDVNILHERLLMLRVQQPNQLNPNSRKRPSLGSHHRPRSSPHVARALGQMPDFSHIASSVVIVHFTSLVNYRSVKDMIQNTMSAYSGTSVPLPEVMIIPKPAGPRRFLTALHTAITKPVVDSFFTPTATSPSTPSLRSGNSFFKDSYAKTSSPRPPGSRSNSDRSTRSPKDSLGDFFSHPPPSPLGKSDGMEYFSEAAVKLGTSPSSGLVIQSPDGQPAGIFFHPKAKTGKSSASSLTMERDQGQLLTPADRGRIGLLSRRTSESHDGQPPMGSVSFSSLHTVSTSPAPPQLALEIGDSQRNATPNAKRRTSDSHPLQMNDHVPANTSLQSPVVVASRRPSSSDTLLRKGSTPPGSPLSETPNAPKESHQRQSVPKRSPIETRPKHPSPITKKGKASTDPNIVPPINVLVVDDNPINQTILVTFMKKKKIKYDVAKNGLEAVQKWKTGGFHLILMDIQMPIMDGIQATKEIRRLENLNAAAGYPPLTPRSDGQGTPLCTPSESPLSELSRSSSSPYRSSVIIVALTASSLQSDRVAALAAGCNDFLTKPVSLLWLNNKIIEWGSIKALQMWADLRPDLVKSISTEQDAHARNVAQRLHVPEGRGTPSPSRSPSIPKTVAPMQSLLEQNSILPSVSSITRDRPKSTHALASKEGPSPGQSKTKPDDAITDPTVITISHAR